MIGAHAMNNHPFSLPAAVVSSSPSPALSLLHQRSDSALDKKKQFILEERIHRSEEESEMFRMSNNIIGILNFLMFLLSVPILAAGIWLADRASTNCEKFLDRPLIIIGALLMLVSISGFVGAWCRVSWLLWLYLLFMFLLILLLFCFTVFAFAVTNKGAGEALSGRGYKEYKLGDYSNWLQKRVNNPKNWNKIRSCLQDSDFCKKMAERNANSSDFYKEHLSSVQSGCCKPGDECGFTYVSPTVWSGRMGAAAANPDCMVWDNNPKVLCYNCRSCKAGVLEQVKRDWKKVAMVNVVFLVFIVAVYSIGCCAFRNNREEGFFRRKPYG